MRNVVDLLLLSDEVTQLLAIIMVFGAGFVYRVVDNNSGLMRNHSDEEPMIVVYIKHKPNSFVLREYWT